MGYGIAMKLREHSCTVNRLRQLRKLRDLPMKKYFVPGTNSIPPNTLLDLNTIG